MEGRNRGNPPQFPDPFAGFGFGRSMLSDFFGRDPFDDPFFTRPFGSAFDRPFNSVFDNAPPFGVQSGLLGDINRNATQSRPVITEVEDDDTDTNKRGSSQRSRDVPLVEHPDDDDEQVAGKNQRGGREGWRDITVTDNGGRGSTDVGIRGFNDQRGGQVRTFSYSTSSVYQSGINGQHTYSSTTARRTGPGGVLEEQHVESDSRNGDTVRHSRGIGDKGRTVVRKKSRYGEDVEETFHNMTEDEVQHFDANWQTHAERSLPQYGMGSRMDMQPRAGGGSGQRALPQSSSRQGGLSGGRYA